MSRLRIRRPAGRSASRSGIAIDQVMSDNLALVGRWAVRWSNRLPQVFLHRSEMPYRHSGAKQERSRPMNTALKARKNELKSG